MLWIEECAKQGAPENNMFKCMLSIYIVDSVDSLLGLSTLLSRNYRSRWILLINGCTSC